MPGGTDAVMVIPYTRGLYSGTRRSEPYTLCTGEDVRVDALPNENGDLGAALNDPVRANHVACEDIELHEVAAGCRQPEGN
jgi:hypothetical protein